MLRNEQLESLLYISENPNNISVDSRVPREILRYLKKEGYVTIKGYVRGADGNDYFHYVLTDKRRRMV